MHVMKWMSGAIFLGAMVLMLEEFQLKVDRKFKDIHKFKSIRNFRWKK